MKNNPLTRRQLIARAGATTAGLMIARSSFANDNRLTTDDPAAAGLGYVESGDAVDTGKWPTYAAGQQCSTCVLYKAGSEGDNTWGACGIFPGKQVKATGWCSAWNAG